MTTFPLAVRHQRVFPRWDRLKMDLPMVTASINLMELAQTPQIRSSLDPCFSEYCHAFNNRLNSLKLSLYLAQRQATTQTRMIWGRFYHQYESLEQHFENFEAVCRPLKVAPLPFDLNLLIDDRSAAWTKAFAAVGSRLELVMEPSPVIISCDVERLGQALDDLVHWRADESHGSRVIRLEQSVTSKQMVLRWSESSFGGLDDSAHRDEREPSWALPILGRIVAEHNGVLEVDPKAGWHLVMCWPLGS